MGEEVVKAEGKGEWGGVEGGLFIRVRGFLLLVIFLDDVLLLGTDLTTQFPILHIPLQKLHHAIRYSH